MVQARTNGLLNLSKQKMALYFQMAERIVNDHGLKSSDFLVFQYAGDSSFKVQIFEATGCEQAGSYFVKNLGFFSQGACTSRLHRNNNDAYLSEPNEVIDISTEEIGVDEQDLEDCSPKQNAAEYNRKGKRTTRSKSKGKKKINPPSLKDPNIFGNEGEDEEGEASSARSDEHSGCRSRKRGSKSRAKQPQKYYVSNRKNPTAQEKQRAYADALEHMIRSKSTGTGRPMVEITMLPSHVYSGFHLTIRNAWARQHMLRQDHQVELKVPGVERSWTVGCRWTPSQCQIIAKWDIFVLDNNLEQDDVCVFELIQEGDGRRKTVLKVHIFRAVIEIFPLTVSRRIV